MARQCRSLRWLAPALVGLRALGAPLAGDEGMETYGCEANPTGDPIGGGEGYSDILAGGDRTARNADELLAAIVEASAGDVIHVPDGCEIDLTGHTHIPIPAGVTLAGSRGRDGSQGARIFTTHRDTYPLLRTDGENVRITGLRFEGPYGGRERTADLAAFLVAAHHGCEVDNCEIYNLVPTRQASAEPGPRCAGRRLRAVLRGVGYAPRVPIGGLNTRPRSARAEYRAHAHGA
jgi:hypothetical protein